MTLERPKPLDFGPRAESKTLLKQMLEQSQDEKSKTRAETEIGFGPGYSSPLREIDPRSLDELVQRIDSGSLSLSQVPHPDDIEQLVQMYWKMRNQFNLEQQQGLVNRPRKRQEGTNSGPVKSILDALKR